MHGMPWQSPEPLRHKSSTRRYIHMINFIAKIKRALIRLYADRLAVTQIEVHRAMDELKVRPKYQASKSLIPYGYKMYSQADEDGMIAEIFHRIGVTNKTFVECGIGDGLENNTLALLHQGWKGLWIDANSIAIDNIRNEWAGLIGDGDLKVEHAFITRTNIDALIKKNIESKIIDLLSIDLDGNDWHIYEAISAVEPRVIVFEYNAKFPPPVRFCMEYDAEYVRSGDCFGFSLQFIVDKMEGLGYRLVGCNLSGANAFFVRQELLQDHFLSPYTAAVHYEPARYYLAQLHSGQKPSYQTIARAIRSK